MVLTFSDLRVGWGHGKRGVSASGEVREIPVNGCQVDKEERHSGEKVTDRVKARKG